MGSKTENEKKDKPDDNSETPQETQEEITLCTEDIDRTIRNHVYASMGLGLAPIPLLDLVGLGAIQINLVRCLAKEHQVPFKKNVAKTIISALVGGILPVGVAPLFTSLVKFIPFVGLTTGAVSMSILGGASTYALGRVFNKHFASGGTLLDMDTEKIQKGFKEQYEKGKDYASSLKKKKVTNEKDTAGDEKTKTTTEPKTA